MFKKLFQPEFRPLTIRVVVVLICVGIALLTGKPPAEDGVEHYVQLLMAFLGGSQVIPRIGDSK